MATNKKDPKATTRTRKAAKKEKVTPTIKAGVRTKKKAPQYRVHGQVKYADGRPAAAVKVIAFDKDVPGADQLGEATTDADGYQITYSAAKYRRSPHEKGGADVFVRVYGANGVLLFQSRTVRNAPADLLLNVQLPVAQDVKLPAAQFVVRGQVLLGGKPAVGALVRAYYKYLRFKDPLGKQETTDQEGRYQIVYSAEQFSRAEKGRADLHVCVVNEKGDELVFSELSNAPKEAMLDLILPVEPEQRSQFELLTHAILPLLKSQGKGSHDLKVEELEEDKQHQDLSFLSGETGFEKKDLARFAMAHRLAQPSLQPEFWFALLGGSFFQFAENQSLTVQLAALLDSLPSLDAAALRKTLTRAFNRKEISEAFREKVVNWIEAFLKFVASRSVSGEGKPTFVKSALDDAGITSAQKQEKFARLFNEHKALTPELLATLEKDQSFKKTEIADLRTSYQLAELTHGDFSVVKMLKEEFDVREPEKIRTLAKKSESEWVNLVKEKHAAGDIKLPIEMGEISGQIKFPAAEVYGKTLERQFREAFPTTAFAGGLERALQNGGAHGLRRAQDLRRFLEGHEQFELLNTPVDDFLKNNTHPDFRALANDENFRLEAKAVQRVFKFLPIFGAVDTLLMDDVHSAQKVYRMGESEFVRSYADRPGFTAETARLAWNRAADTYGAVLTVVADLKALEAEALPFALKNNNEELSRFPNWNNLFKTGDLCECEQCRSAVSPAAYFADLLIFLKDRKSKKLNPDGTGNYSVKDILFDRRPDLGYLELNCDNALTPLPYIDVVCEVLEDAVDATHANYLELTVTAAPGVDLETAFKKVFKDAFTDPLNDGKEKIELGGNISFSPMNPAGPDPDQFMVVHSDNVTYLLLVKSAPVHAQSFKRVDDPGTPAFAAILCNTKASAAELRAYPQYVNPKAYDKLRAAKYPLTLPFDLFAEEVGAAFQKTNLQRWDLMRTLRGPAAPNNPTDGDIAAEYFGISSSANPADPSEKRLILEADEPGQQAVWGEAAIPGNLKNVKVFLQKTGLEYNELLALLDLKFINPKGDIRIHDLDPSCDIDRKIIQGLDDPSTAPAKLDRIHRFLRMWRKLQGWKMWELDLVIRLTRIGNQTLDEPFLVQLFFFSQLRDRLGKKTTVEQVCALFADLNTETRFTKLHEKREDALYQSLFLNKRLINPLDPAYEIDPVTNETRPIIDPITQLSTRQKISDHYPVVLAALGIREADLVLLKELTRSDVSTPLVGTPYVTDDLTLAHLSFLWRHAWLSKLLKFTAEEWKTILKIFQQDIPQYDDPRAAWKFVEKIDLLKDAGFTPDELNWLLAADHTAKAAVKEADAARFLTALRKELQGIHDEYDPAQYGFLTAVTNEEQLIGLLTTLLQKLNRDEGAVSVFLKTLRGRVLLEASAVLAGFTFPTTITAAAPIGIGIPIQYNAGVFRFTGLMTDAQRKTLLDDALPALVTLRQSAQLEADVQGGLPGFTFPQTITAGANPIAIQYVEPGGVGGKLRLVGLMTDAQRAALLDTTDFSLAAVVGNPAYRSAIEQLYQESLTAVSNYRSVIEELYQQSLKAVADYISMEKDVTLPGTFVFPATITGAPNAISIRCEQVLRFTGVMTADERDTLLAVVTGIDAYDAAIEKLFRKPGTATVTGLPADFTFPPTITGMPNNISISLEQVLRFTGVMTKAQKQTLLNDPFITVRGIAAYQAAIEEFFYGPYLAVKFFEPVFTAPLAKLPSEVDFKSLPDQLAAKITYDAEQRLLRFSGFMSNTEKPEILLLSGDADYVTAVNSLATQPQTLASPDDRIWLMDDDLDIAKPDNDTYSKRLATAARKALKYLSATSAENAVVQQSSAQLGLTEALTRRLLTSYAVVPTLPTKTTLMAHLRGNFTIDSTTYKSWFWANRAAAILKKWKITLAELEKIITLTAGAKLLDFLTLPLDTSGTIASLEKFLRTSRLLKLRDSLPEDEITLLEVLEKLNNGAYPAVLKANVLKLPPTFLAFPRDITGSPNNIPIQYDQRNNMFRFTGLMTVAQRTTLLNHASLGAVTGIAIYQKAIEQLFKSPFAVDVERLNEAWLAADVEALITSLNITYPADYLLAESWERLRRAFYFLDNLNAGANTVEKFAAPAMTAAHAKAIKELLRSKFGAETWLALSVEIQDALRERKRDALAAYLLLTQPKKPADAPSRKWENTTDLYAYYLLDIEMASCQLTSRLVQASGSVQLFVQRCFMGLEPDVVVQADGANGDSAWRWWKWMRKYQVWVANRKVFLWPENWIEPELKKDRSPFFKDMENELLQNEVNQYTVEAAFSNYLEKLDGVAQLEIAGFYQEDDGDNAIVHVFGRTAGAEPHLYYYRRYDYRQWTPWEKVELDIQGDYLIPAVVNKRLFLFWPIFTEVSDEGGNRRMTVPIPGQKRFTPDQTQKKLRLQMAVSDYRQGRWTPKKVSKDFIESESYTAEIVRQNYQFVFIGRGDGHVGIQYDGYSVGSTAAASKAKEYIKADVAATTLEAGTTGNAFITKTAADTLVEKALLATGEIAAAVSLVKTLNPIIDNLLPVNDDSMKNAGSVQVLATIGKETTYNLGLPERPGDPRKGFSPFVLDVAGSSDAAFLAARTFQEAVHTAEMNFFDVETNAGANWNKDQLRPFVKKAVNMAKLAVAAGEKALRAVEAFESAAIDSARSANRKLEEAVAANMDAIYARDHFYPDNEKHAIFSPGFFDISSCTGVPEKADSLGTFTPVIRPELDSVDENPAFLKWVELTSRDASTNDFTLATYVAYLTYYPTPTVFGTLHPTLVLKKTPGIFKMSSTWHLSYFDTWGTWLELFYNDAPRTLGTLLPFFYNDKERTFFVLPSIEPGLNSAIGSVRDYYPDIKKFVRQLASEVAFQGDIKVFLDRLILSQKFHFKNFYHPFICEFAKLVYNPLRGIPALMSRETQLNDIRVNDTRDTEFSFEGDYEPDAAVVKLPPQYPLLPDSYPREVVDFTPDGAYSSYNWELFFHAPLMIANSLSKNQRFEEARDWYHFIFNPIGVESGKQGAPPMSKYWITKPFFETTDPQYVQQRIENIMRMLAGDISLQDYSPQAKKDLEDQVFDWRTNPFEPHRIANYRTVAYQKTVVMKYLDNLIAWGDNLFRQDSMESINEATQLYILAAEILGPRPKVIPPQAKPPVESFNELEIEFDKFSNALVQVENLVPMMSGNYHSQFNVPEDRPQLPMLYFCIPQNDKMLGYWDTVADRLYKIRNCMNIEGVLRQLALFEPPIDPAALVKAVADGLDISSALADLNAPLPLYRFNILLQKANEICNDVKALGGALLAALEKNDAEAMGLLRQDQEIRLLEAVKTVREQQIEEAKENLAGVKQNKKLAEIKKKYYESKEFMNALENASAALAGGAIGISGLLASNEVLASGFFLLPSFNLGVSGVGGSPQVTLQWGSENIAKSIQSANSALQHVGSILSQSSSMVGSIANYQRRKEEWDFQTDLATKELDQIDRQIASAELRIAIAEKELDNHVIQIENAKATDEFMRSKYTNQELFQWQVGQISGVYFQSYKLAYDLAKRAERCFRFELGLPDSSYINFGYWDSLKKGLLSGEKLQYDLRRLETAYLEQNRREFELTKHISLVLLDPLALVKLRETGRCFFRLPEEIFDLDYPGHYFRRMKSVSLTLPCVVGPYTTISCTLRLLKNSVRINTANGNDGYHRNADGNGLPADDERFIENNIPVKAIAASGAQNDSGVFELSFRDERYLPFEGAGAVSEWALELFSDAHPDFGKPLRQFDYKTISDAILHVKYTAREDAGTFKNGAVAHLRDYFSQADATPSLRLFNLRQEFPTQWHRFLNPTNATSGNVLELEMAPGLFPWRDSEKTLTINTVWLLARCTNPGSYNVVMTAPLLPPATPLAVDLNMALAPVNQYGGLHFGQKDVSGLEIKVSPTGAPGNWRLTMTPPHVGNLLNAPAEVEDVLLVLGYEWT